MSATGQQRVSNGSRLVGWKAIAAHLGVSQRTAVRWAETYDLPISRVPRGERPVVFSTAEELDNWWLSAAAASIRGERGPEAESESTASRVDGVLDASPAEKADGGGPPSRPLLWSPRWIKAAAFGLGLPLAVLVAGYAGGRHWSSLSDRTLAWRTRAGAHGQALSTQRVRLTLTIDEKPTSVVVSEGEMARLETPTSRLGLQSRVAGGALKVFFFRLGRAGSRESATFVESRSVAAGSVERVSLDGSSVQLSWDVVQGLGSAAREPPKEPCCMVCNGVAVCGELVSGECGRCDASAGARR